MVGVSPSLHGAENSGGPCIDNMRFRYVKGRSRRFAAVLDFVDLGQRCSHLPSLGCHVLIHAIGCLTVNRSEEPVIRE